MITEQVVQFNCELKVVYVKKKKNYTFAYNM